MICVVHLVIIHFLTYLRHAEGDPDAAAAEAAAVPVKAVVVSDNVPFLPQYLFCRDLVWQAWVLQGPAIQPTPSIPTNAG